MFRAYFYFSLVKMWNFFLAPIQNSRIFFYESNKHKANETVFTVAVVISSDKFEVKKFPAIWMRFDGGKTMHLRQRSTNKWILQLMVKREKFHYRKLQHMHKTRTHIHVHVHHVYVEHKANEWARASHTHSLTRKHLRMSDGAVKQHVCVCLWGNEKVIAGCRPSNERKKESRFSRMLPSIFNQRVCNDMHSEREKELRAHTLYVLQQI